MLKLYSFHIQVFHLPLHGTLYTEVTHHLMHATSFMSKVKRKQAEKLKSRGMKVEV